MVKKVYLRLASPLLLLVALLVVGAPTWAIATMIATIAITVAGTVATLTDPQARQGRPAQL